VTVIKPEFFITQQVNGNSFTYSPIANRTSSQKQVPRQVSSGDRSVIDLAKGTSQGVFALLLGNCAISYIL